MSEILVRPALHADLGFLSEIWQELMDFHESSDERFALASDAVERWHVLAEDMLAREDAFLHAACNGGDPVGFCLGWIARNPPIYRVAEVGFISEIAVSRRQQRRGVGRALIREAMRFFASQGVQEFQLSTAVWNEGAHEFWKALGGEVLLLRYRFPLEAEERS
jgi:ribosomal protein S18 acetylase RimI-like enzyme